MGWLRRSNSNQLANDGKWSVLAALPGVEIRRCPLLTAGNRANFANVPPLQATVTYSLSGKLGEPLVTLKGMEVVE